MPDAVLYAELPWSPRHGDTEHTPPVALFTATGEPVDLADWTIRAQVRDRAGEVVHTFERGAGIVVGRGEASFSDDRPPVTTATLRLRLRPQDWPPIPRRLRGALYDAEISRGEFTRTVLGGPFEPVEDVTR